MHIRKKQLYILILIAGMLTPANKAFSQDRTFARHIVDTLSSPYFSGRGYVCKGGSLAASFIAKEFRSFGLDHFNTLQDYEQPYTMYVNTFPGRLKLTVDGKTLQPGADFLVSAESDGLKKTKFHLLYASRLLTLDEKAIEKIHYKKTALFSTDAQLDSLKEKAKDNPLLGIALAGLKIDLYLISKPKLIWTVYGGLDEQREPLHQRSIEVKEGTIPPDAQEVSLQIDQEFISSYKNQNICGFVKGKAYPDSFILFTAHYDHLGRMGCATYFPGANDNASGTAMLLDLARYYSQPKHRPEYSIAFIAFSGEEAGLLGSRYFTEHPPVPLKNMSFVINMDLMANGQDGIMVVNGSIFNKEFDMLTRINNQQHYLKEIKKRGKAANSDHYWFSEKGVKAFFVYLLGDYPYYHDIYDTSEKPTFAGYDGAFRLLTDFIANLTGEK